MENRIRKLGFLGQWVFLTPKDTNHSALPSGHSAPLLTPLSFSLRSPSHTALINIITFTFTNIIGRDQAAPGLLQPLQAKHPQAI